MAPSMKRGGVKVQQLLLVLPIELTVNVRICSYSTL